jgi:hypothetical protein
MWLAAYLLVRILRLPLQKIKKKYVDLKFLQEFIPKENIGLIEVLYYLKFYNCFSNVNISCRILLIIYVTVASAKWNFSKLNY